jgi:hypothetical protein
VRIGLSLAEEDCKTSNDVASVSLLHDVLMMNKQVTMQAYIFSRISGYYGYQIT